MDGSMARWRDGWIDGGMGGWLAGWVGEWMGLCGIMDLLKSLPSGQEFLAFC